MPIDMRKVDKIAGQIAGLISTITEMVAGAPESSPYDVLGVKPTDPDKVIDAIYKARAGLAHPDKGGDEEEFKRINRAYEKIKEMRKGEDNGSKIR